MLSAELNSNHVGLYTIVWVRLIVFTRMSEVLYVRAMLLFEKSLQCFIKTVLSGNFLRKSATKEGFRKLYYASYMNTVCYRCCLCLTVDLLFGDICKPVVNRNRSCKLLA